MIVIVIVAIVVVEVAIVAAVVIVVAVNFLSNEKFFAVDYKKVRADLRLCVCPSFYLSVVPIST